MKKLTDLEYLRLNTFQRLWYNIVLFVLGIPGWLASLVKAVGNGIAGAFRGIRNELTDCATTFTRGSWKTKVSYLVMGFGNIARGQVLRGLLFLVFEAVFIVYMVTTGSYWLGKFRTLGDVPPGEVYNEVLDTYVRVNGDDSFKILLYGLLTILFIIAFVYTWRLNVKQNRISEEILATGKKLKSGKDDLRSVLDDQFHKTLLALPITGILVFTVIPILFMILVAFTNYDGAHDGYSNLFTWVGLNNFNELISSSSADANLSYTFGEILSWTLMWAFFATFTNYFLGMLVAILINNAGGALKMPKGEFCDMPLDYWDSQIALNLSGAAYLSHEAIKNMKEHNIPGRIVNISSIHGSVTWVKRKALPYCAGKGGIEMFTKTLAIEVAKYGIRVNCVAPGLILTGVMSRYSDRDVEGFRRKIAAGYLATPEDIVPMIQFFADVEKTKYIVGQTIAVDGGQSIDGAIDCMLEDEF